MSNSHPLKVALIGCGAVSELYYSPALRELEKLDLLQVQVLFDPNANRVVELNRFFPSATHVRDIAELSKRGINLAIVASPPRYHADQTIQILKSGISVLCEKPMAVRVDEGQAMIESALAAKKTLAIGLFRRFFPATQAIYNILALHILGEVKSFYCYEGSIFSWPVQSRSFFEKTTGQGGALIDIGVHVLDLLIWWWGYPVEVFYEDDAMGGIEANCRIKLHFSQGFSGEVRISRDLWLPNRYFIQCTKGWLSWNANEADGIQMGLYGGGSSFNIQLHEDGRENGLPTLGGPSFNFQQSFVRQLRNVVSAIQGKEQLVISSEQGLQSLQLMEYCYRHRTLMTMPWMSETEYQQAQHFNSLTT